MRWSAGPQGAAVADLHLALDDHIGADDDLFADLGLAGR